MKFDKTNLIQACNDCILSCENTLKKCVNACSSEKKEDCVVGCQKTVDACYKCIHECNVALDNKGYETLKQKDALERCIEACRKGAKSCTVATDKILSMESEGCEWAADSLNECISACDECIESLEE